MRTFRVQHVLLTVVIFASLLYQHARAEREQFFGGSMSYRIEKQAKGTDLVTIELITAWVLGKGPCGPGCNSSDIGKSTRSTRPLITKTYPDFFGNYTTDYLNASIDRTEIHDINALVLSTYNETVIAVNVHEKWEQELLHFSFIMPPRQERLDVNFDGESWRKLTLQSGKGRWHLQTKISTALRSDTGKPNHSPRSFARPYYRVKLSKVTEIDIPAVDADGDYIKCEMAAFVEGGEIANHRPPLVTVFENCSISIIASESSYTDDTWIAVPVSVRDYNRVKITYGTEDSMPAKYSLSATTVQFLVQVKASLTTPEFVEPTHVSNHVFIMYAGTSFRTKIYAKAVENTTIESFTALGIQREKIKLSSIQQDPRRPQVKNAIMTWKPSSADIGRHILCISALDSTGVDSAQDRCFILDVKGDVFNHSTKALADRPYFVDIPSPEQFVLCKIHTTCVVALYVKSKIEIVDVHVTDSFVDKYELGPIQSVTHTGETMYQTDLSFEHSVPGKERICFVAKDKNRAESENVCIQSKIEPPDPCMSAPCRNSATCVMDTVTGGFKCLCWSGSSGKFCEKKEDPCKPYPCFKENTVICVGVPGMLCYCKDGFTGDRCDINMDDCHADACNGHGICKDKLNGFYCQCFSRYYGTHCENDLCSAQPAGIMSCPEAGCHHCQEDGVCVPGTIYCSCPYGFTGYACETGQCDIAAAVNGVKIVSPSANDGSRVICYKQGDTISSCETRLYLAVKSGSNPKADVETTSALKTHTSIGPVTKSSVLPGISTMYSTDVYITGKINSTDLQFFCVHASVGRTSTSSICYEISFVSNPESDSKTLAFAQRNARVKFVQPTLKDQSRLVCKINEKCHILMYTSFASNRSACLGTSFVSSGNFTGCDKDDRDNDEGDLDTSAKSRDPCCEDVISPRGYVTVFHTHPRGPSCVTEASFTFPSAGEKDICFQSAGTDSQQVCYKVDVHNSTLDPCSSSPCLNNGHCFHDDHNNFKCICADNYTGDNCEKGPCQPADNNCQNGGYCQTYFGAITCICKAGYSGQNCNQDPSSLHVASAEFTDTANPTVFPCVLHKYCSISLLLTGPNGYIPTVTPGYVDLSILLEEIVTVDRTPVDSSYQTDIKIKPLELGVKDMCIQTLNMTGVNTDEICFKVNVISDVISLYGFKDRPHFIEPSMPTNTEVQCLAEGPCHVLYHVTPGTGNENECVTFQPHPPDGFIKYHLFSSCGSCNPGDYRSGNCTVDLSMVNTNTDIGVVRHFCLSVGLKGSSVEGETRCFNMTVKDPRVVSKTGCQVLKCENGGFCDGHDPSQPICYCPKGISGISCQKAEELSSLISAQTQTFIGDVALPAKLKCIVNKSCSIPFQIVSKPGITPAVSLGYTDQRLFVDVPSLKAFGNSSTVFEGYTFATPSTTGKFKLCLQAKLNSKTEDEMCMMIEVIGKAFATTDKTKPHFLPSTITTDSTVLCVVNKSCHFDMHFTKGDNFGFVGRCPVLTETSRSPVQGVHIFDGKRQATDCTSDVSYIPPAVDVEHMLCLQVALPGKKGEERCYTIKIVNDTNREVISPCRGVTCEHGGNCLADFRSSPPTSYCLCTVGFTGSNCETDIGDCVPTPCKNGATCIEQGSNYTCTCGPGFTGRNCEIVEDPCNSHPCVRGTCYHNPPLYHCLCPVGYTGKKCEISINECQSQPCLNGGVCVDNVGYFTCNCSSGYAGKLCETDINECLSQPCLNGGFCKDGINQFVCQCRSGFGGDRCQNDINPCTSNPCVKGICFWHGSRILCECPKGFTGELCETAIKLTLNGPKETYLNVPVGSELMLNCSMSWLPPPTLYWSKLNGCGIKFETFKASVYRQLHATIGDSGTYTCSGSIGSGPNITKFFHVNITALHKDEVCDFDDGTLCGWKQQKNDNFDWTFQNGPTQSVGTGPDVDHTLGTVQGTYIYVESSAPRTFGEHASIISHVLPANRTMCFELWYYMFGDGSGQLFVYVQDTCTKIETELFKEAGNKGEQWNKASVTIVSHSVPNDYRIVLTADIGPTYHGDTAVDDLIIHDGPCQGSHGAPIIG